jgi:hypothetical protein
VPIEPWWETNPATTPRQELGMVSPELAELGMVSPELVPGTRSYVRFVNWWSTLVLHVRLDPRKRKLDLLAVQQPA